MEYLQFQAVVLFLQVKKCLQPYFHVLRLRQPHLAHKKWLLVNQKALPYTHGAVVDTINNKTMNKDQHLNLGLQKV